MGRVVPAVVRATAILELFLGDQDELTARDITDALELPRTTVHELTSTLVQLGYLAPGLDGANTFRLGVKLLQLGSTYGERLDLSVEGRAVAQNIAHECAETVHVAVLDAADVIYIAKVDSTRSVRMVSAQGRRLPAHCTSVGKMLLSRLSDHELETLYAGHTLQALTPQSITTLPALETELAKVRAAGVAFERMESNPEVACVAAPVYDHKGAMVAAMSISVPIVRWDDRSLEDWAKLVECGAHTLSENLGAPHLREHGDH